MERLSKVWISGRQSFESNFDGCSGSHILFLMYVIRSSSGFWICASSSVKVSSTTEAAICEASRLYQSLAVPVISHKEQKPLFMILKKFLSVQGYIVTSVCKMPAIQSTSLWGEMLD